MTTQSLAVEFMFAPGCPCAQPALRLLRKVLAEEHCESPVIVRVIASEEEAMRRGVRGSPTILVDGVDIEGPAFHMPSDRLACRRYEPHGEYAGVPDAAVIRQALYVHPGKRRPGAALR